jgi:hypothetical protein
MVRSYYLQRQKLKSKGRNGTLDKFQQKPHSSMKLSSSSEDTTHPVPHPQYHRNKTKQNKAKQIKASK